MPTLTLPVTEVVKALNTYAYEEMLEKIVTAATEETAGARKVLDMLLLSKNIHGGAQLTPGQIADLHMDGMLMAGFLRAFMREVPHAVMAAFATGWDEAGRQRGQELASLLVSTAACFPEGPFLYILGSLSVPDTWRDTSVYRSHQDKMDSAKKDWAELFSGQIKGFIRRAPTESNPYLKLAGERLTALGLLAQETPAGRKIIAQGDEDPNASPYAYTTGRLAEAVLSGYINLLDNTPAVSVNASPGV